jgi:hypothetical protein
VILCNSQGHNEFTIVNILCAHLNNFLTIAFIIVVTKSKRDHYDNGKCTKKSIKTDVKELENIAIEDKISRQKIGDYLRYIRKNHLKTSLNMTFLYRISLTSIEYQADL